MSSALSSAHATPQCETIATDHRSGQCGMTPDLPLPPRVLARCVAAVRHSRPSRRTAKRRNTSPQLPDMSRSTRRCWTPTSRPAGSSSANYDDRQLIYFTALQTMHCRLSEIRYSVNSDAARPALPARRMQSAASPSTCRPTNRRPNMSTSRCPHARPRPLTIQVVWDDGAGSEIVDLQALRQCRRSDLRPDQDDQEASKVLPQPKPATSGARRNRHPGKTSASRNPNRQSALAAG